MKLRNLLLCGICALSTTFVSAQTTFPFTLTTADGLPEQTSAAAKEFERWVSPTYTFDEEVSSFRLTVTHTSWQDAYNTSTNGGRGYIFFTMGEFYLYDAAGNQVELTADNFYGNATESVSTGDGVIGNLCDGDEGTHYHTMYSATDEPRPIAQEFYLEVTLPQPMKSFSFGFAKRSNNANIPSEIIVTKGGEDADPYAEFGFELGEKVETIEPGGLYVFADEGKINTENWGENNGMTTYLATGRDPRYASPAGTDKYYRLRRKANVDCIFKAESAGEGEFYLKSYLGESYIKSYAASDGSVFVEQATSFSEAAKFHLDEEGYLVCNNHYYATNSQETLVAYDHAVRVMTIFKASVGGEFALQDLQTAIADAESALAEYKEKVAAGDDGETAALEAAVAAAKTMTADSPSDEIFAAAQELNAATSDFLKLMIYTFVDEISEILDNDEIVFGSELGMYPAAQKNILEETLTQLMYDLDNREFNSFVETKSYVEKVQKKIDEFWASKLDNPTELPIHLIGENGAILFEKMEGLGNYIYTSPTIFLPEPIETIFITTVQTNDGDSGGGWPCTNWAHFTLRDENGETVFLDESNFDTNAIELGDGDGIPGICDYNEDGTPNLVTYMHTNYKESKPETNEHYIQVIFPQPMNIFSFDLISRENGRLIPTEMVIDTVPYHYEPEATINVREQVTSASELDPNKYYIFYGNINKVDKGSAGSGFYAGIKNAYGDKALAEGVFKLIPGETEGAYKVHFIIEDVYLERPTSWTSTAGTALESEAGEFFFTESENLADAFKVWAGPTEADEPDLKYMLQDWSGHLGYFTISGEGFENDDTDGESDWYIYETDPVPYNVYVSQIRKASQLNTEDLFAMYGNLEVVSKGTEGSGFYRGLNPVGKQATNMTLFQLESGANGTYKIHFVEDDVYLKNPTSWAAMETTDNAAEAGEFVFAESENLAGAFKIYTTGTFYKDEGNPSLVGLNMLQDWGSYMGSYPIESLDDDDTDGESDWTLFKYGDLSDFELDRKDYLGDYTYTYDYYWDDHSIKEIDFILEADPESEDGVVVNDFYNTGKPLKGVFDGKAHTITFAPMQELDGYQDDKDDYTFFYRSTSSDKSPITFVIDLVENRIIYKGQAGFVYRNNNFDPSIGENDDNKQWPYWKQLSYSYIELVPVLIGDDWLHVDNAVGDDAEVVSVSFYTVGGQAVAAPAKGVNIVRTVLSDGTVKTAKVLIR